MKVRKAGHIYELDTLDGDGKPIVVTFVCREAHLGLQPGTQTQEVLRMITDLLEHDMKVVTELQELLIDRTNHCDACIRWEGNDRVIKAMSESARQARLALVFHEQRALERHFEKGFFDPVKVPTGPDGHFKLEGVVGTVGPTGIASMTHVSHERSGKDRRIFSEQASSVRWRGINRRKGERRKGAESREFMNERRGTFHPDHGWNKLGNLDMSNEGRENPAPKNYGEAVLFDAPMADSGTGYAKWLLEGSKERRVGKERRKYAPDVAHMIWAHEERRSGGDQRKAK